MALGYGALISGEEADAKNEGTTVNRTKNKSRQRGNELRNILVARANQNKKISGCRDSERKRRDVK